MIITISEILFNSTNKAYYEIRPQYYTDGTVEFEVYYRYREDCDWTLETTKKTRASAIKYIKNKGVE